METSDIVAVSALFVSIIAGVTNWRHTSKAFKISISPVVETSLEFRDSSTPICKTRNLSQANSASAIQIVLEIRRPFAWRSIFVKRNIPASKTDVRGFSLGPLEEQEFEVSSLIENTLLKNFPEYMEKRNDIIYVLAPEQPITVVISTHYVSATIARKKLKTRRLFPLFANTPSSDDNRFMGWKHQRL